MVKLLKCTFEMEFLVNLLDSGFFLCLDIDECAENRDNCDQLCTNTQGGYTCSCRSGYSLASNGQDCNGQYKYPFWEGKQACHFVLTTFADINECTSNTDNCAQTCSNTVGGFTCGCFSGYRRNNDGITCRGE